MAPGDFGGLCTIYFRISLYSHDFISSPDISTSGSSLYGVLNSDIFLISPHKSPSLSHLSLLYTRLVPFSYVAAVNPSRRTRLSIYTRSIRPDLPRFPHTCLLGRCPARLQAARGARHAGRSVTSNVQHAADAKPPGSSAGMRCSCSGEVGHSRDRDSERAWGTEACRN